MAGAIKVNHFTVGDGVKQFSVVLIMSAIVTSNAYGWKGDVHQFIAEKGGFPGIDATCPDRSDKGRFSNHYYNAEENETITPELIRNQVKIYDTGAQKGALYGAVLDSFEQYRSGEPIDKACKPVEYFVHYVGDLSNPFHNILRDEWTKTNHGINDKADVTLIEDDELSTVKLKDCSEDLIAKIAEVANVAKGIGYAAYNAQTPRVSEQDKKAQIIRSINLLRGIKKYCLKQNNI